MGIWDRAMNTLHSRMRSVADNIRGLVRTIANSLGPPTHPNFFFKLQSFSSGCNLAFNTIEKMYPLFCGAREIEGFFYAVHFISTGLIACLGFYEIENLLRGAGYSDATVEIISAAIAISLLVFAIYCIFQLNLLYFPSPDLLPKGVHSISSTWNVSLSWNKSTDEWIGQGINFIQGISSLVLYMLTPGASISLLINSGLNFLSVWAVATRVWMVFTTRLGVSRHAYFHRIVTVDNRFWSPINLTDNSMIYTCKKHLQTLGEFVKDTLKNCEILNENKCFREGMRNLHPALGIKQFYK